MPQLLPVTKACPVRSSTTTPVLWSAFTASVRRTRSRCVSNKMTVVVTVNCAGVDPVALAVTTSLAISANPRPRRVSTASVLGVKTSG